MKNTLYNKYVGQMSENPDEEEEEEEENKK